MNIENRYLSNQGNGKYCQNFSIKKIDNIRSEEDIHRDDYYQIILIRKGEGEIMIDFNTYTLKEGVIAFIFPKQVHALHLNDDAEVEVVMFDNTIFCSEILANELKDYNIDLQKRVNVIDLSGELSEFERMVSIVREMMKIDVVSLPRKMQIKFLIKTMIMMVIDNAPNNKNFSLGDSDMQLYREFREMVDADYKEKRIVSEYAAALHLSPKKLTNICTKMSGMSPLKIIHEKVNLEIQKEMLEGSKTIKEMSYEYNFSSQSAFTKYVCSHFGCSPNDLRIKLTGGKKE